jgi:hypothetical protein
MTTGTWQYFGVAATSSRAEVDQLIGMIDQIGLPEGVRFMNGPLVSRKTLRGLSPDNPQQYPPLKRVAGLLVDDPRIFNVIHFNSRDPRLCKQLGQIAELSRRVDGIQLNMLWPNWADLVVFRRMYPYVKLILQVSRQAYDSIGSSAGDLIECLKPYQGCVDYVLFDPSGGLGKPYDRDEARQLLGRLRDSGLDMHWAVTGGLSANSTYGLRELLDMYPQLCWDAQSNLRTGDDDDALDLERCFGFCAASITLLQNRMAGSS